MAEGDAAEQSADGERKQNKKERKCVAEHAETEVAGDKGADKPAAKKSKKELELAADAKPKKEDPKGPRSVIVSGLPEGVTKAQIKHKVKKVGAFSSSA